MLLTGKVKLGSVVIPEINRNNHSQAIMLWQPLDTQGPMISLTSKPQRRSIMWEFTRELNKESLLN